MLVSFTAWVTLPDKTNNTPLRFQLILEQKNENFELPVKPLRFPVFIFFQCLLVCGLKNYQWYFKSLLNT